MFSRDQLAAAIEHTMLKRTATPADVDRTLQEALQSGLRSVCIPPCYVARAAQSADVSVVSVVGFPNGYASSCVKAFEAQKAVEDGASEIDMVANLGAIRSGDTQMFLGDVEQVVRAAREAGHKRGLGHVVVKVIIETCELTYEQKRFACELLRVSGADYVKTSTGFAAGGATLEDVKLLSECAGLLRVKASGGIRTLEQALAMLLAGASRIGTSSGSSIMKEYDERAEAEGERA